MAASLQPAAMYRLFSGLSRLMAYAGGLVLTTLIVLTCVSIVGRSLSGVLHGSLFQGFAPGFSTWALALGVGPVNGDYELIEMGIAFAIFAFLPLCQISNGHASVDLFTRALSPSINRLLQLIIDTVFAMVLILIAVQLFDGMLSKMRSGQTTFLLEVPLWWAYALSMIGAAVASGVGVYIAAVRAAEFFGGRSLLPAAQSTED